MLKETKTTTQSKIPFLWLQSRLPIHKRESRKKAGLLGCSEASEPSRTVLSWLFRSLGTQPHGSVLY
jgi:hypothetical protein